MAESKRTKLAVIGGGPGGYKAAFLAADLGIETVLIDPQENPGGVCLFRGCIPTKALLHSVHQYQSILNSSEVGIEVEGVRPNPEKIRSHKDKVVKKLTGGLGYLAKKRGVRHIRGWASFSSPNSLTIDTVEGGKEELSFDYAILAAGAAPVSLPGMEFDGQRIISSKDALELPKVPESLLVVGAGYIGLELGSVYAGLGSRVTVAEKLPYIMPGADRDLVKEFSRHAGKHFERFRTETEVANVEVGSSGSTVTFRDKEGNSEEAEFETILLTVGRKPNTVSLGLDLAGVETDERGFVTVDAQRRSAAGSIFAVGDLTGGPLLAHKAAAEARVAVETVAGKTAAYDPYAVPAVEYTDPEIAWTGLTENEAEREGRQVEVGRFPWSASGRAATLGRSDGLTKLIFEPETHRLLGGAVVGSGAGELISEISLAVEMGAVAEDITSTIHPHPTLSETVMEAAEDLFGLSTHIYRPKSG
jgi:dihydrolipoamide dehydrogenase